MGDNTEAVADADALRIILQHTLQRLIEAEVRAYIGAEPGEHSPSRTTYRNGYRPEPMDTRVGRLDLQIPKVRNGSFFPSLLEPRRRIERALLAVIQEAGCHRVFVDWASGALDDRPELAKALDHLRPGDTLVVWKLDRLGPRSQIDHGQADAERQDDDRGSCRA